MIPLIKSITELMVITQSRAIKYKNSKDESLPSLEEDSGQRKRYIRSEDEKTINLPDIPRTTRHTWIKSKEAVSKFFDELDYNNQIQSSYDLTLLARQSKSEHQDAA